MASTEKKTAAVKGGVNRGSLKVVRQGKCRSNAQTVLTNWDDMIACGMPKASVENAYQKDFGRKPDQVHLNDDFCKNYGWLSYNMMGETKYYNVAIVPMTDVSGERYLENKEDYPFDHTVTIETTVSNSATTTVTSASSVSMGSSITIGAPELGIGSEFSQSFTFSNEVGSSSTQSIDVKITDTVKVTVPPKSKTRVYLEVKWDSRKEDFEIPVTIDPNGMTGAQFSHQVDGHYYWAVPHGGYFTPPFESVLRGSLAASYNSTGNVVVDPAEPIES